MAQVSDFFNSPKVSGAIAPSLMFSSPPVSHQSRRLLKASATIY